MKLSTLNTCLVGAIVVVNLYTILTPVMPQVLFWFQHKLTDKAQTLTATIHSPSISATADTPYARENRLVIPSMLLDTPILESKSESVLKEGIWRRPKTSTPDQGGNTVIVGHRFTYTNPRGTFYDLHRPRVGDEIGIFWKGTRYLYKITDTKTVPATETNVEDDTETPRLTLYTCTPLWMPKDRLVVIAEPVGEPQTL